MCIECATKHEANYSSSPVWVLALSGILSDILSGDFVRATTVLSSHQLLNLSHASCCNRHHATPIRTDMSNIHRQTSIASHGRLSSALAILACLQCCPMALVLQCGLQFGKRGERVGCWAQYTTMAGQQGNSHLSMNTGLSNQPPNFITTRTFLASFFPLFQLPGSVVGRVFIPYDRLGSVAWSQIIPHAWLCAAEEGLQGQVHLDDAIRGHCGDGCGLDAWSSFC